MASARVGSPIVSCQRFMGSWLAMMMNAQDAVADDGQIKVHTDYRDGWAELSVSDNGSGMSGEFMQKHLFRPFNTTKKQGMGIGLFHCKTIVEAHGGRIEVESEEGKGTMFRVLLPARPVRE